MSKININDTDIIPLYIGICIFGLIHLYHIHISSSFVGTYKDKVYFYLTHLISMSPLTVYTLKLIEIVFYDIERIPLFFSIFYMEWIFATTLMIISLGRFGKTSLSHYIKLSNIDTLMIIGGHISMMGQSNISIYIPYGISCGCFIYILISFLKMYKNSKKINPVLYNTHSNPKEEIQPLSWPKIQKILTIITTISWTGYPIIQIFYKSDIISFGTCLLSNIILDIISKVLFVNILIGTNLVYRGDTSVLAMMSKRMLKIHALDITIKEDIDEKFIHRISLELDMRTPDPNSQEITHITHVSEVGNTTTSNKYITN
jgi:bacteriorhodopsin